MTEPFGDGETGKTSIDSSKKDGIGMGWGAVLGCELNAAGPVTGGGFCTIGVLPPLVIWSVGGVSAGWGSLAASSAAGRLAEISGVMLVVGLAYPFSSFGFS